MINDNRITILLLAIPLGHPMLIEEPSPLLYSIKEGFLK